MMRRLAAILATDVVGYSTLMAKDEAGMLEALRKHRRELFDPEVRKLGGRIVKLMGDGALVEFPSVVDAVQCAVTIQTILAETAGPIRLRIGINLGDVILDGDDIYGEGVNVAARLEALAEPGGICISSVVRESVGNRGEVEFADAGEHEIKGLTHPIRVWAWPAEKVPEPKAAGPTLREKPSIAVLPFTSMSRDPEQEYFADGLVEDIITSLSKLAGLRVIARNSSFVYKGSAVDVREVARSLGVRYVLEGSVRRGGNRIRISAQLIDADDGSHIWAERYDRSIDDIFAVQDEVTLVLATEMQVKLTEGEQARLRHETTTSFEAWTHWVEGLSYFRREITEENISKALQCWKSALSHDPDSATFSAMIGFLHYLDARFGWWDERPEAQRKAKSFADRAMELNPDNADANITASLAMLQHGRYAEAATTARRAVQLAPGSADVTSLACFVLAFSGFAQEAVPLGEKAMRLSPNFPGYFLGTLGNAHRLAGQTDEAIAAFKAYHAKAPGFGLVDLVLTYQQTGRPDEAVRFARKLLSIRRDFTIEAWAETQYRADKAGLEADVSALSAAGLPVR